MASYSCHLENFDNPVIAAYFGRQMGEIRLDGFLSGSF